MKWNIKSNLKKITASLLASTMILGMMSSTVPTLATTSKKAYDVVVKPNLSCDSVKGMYGDSLLVTKKVKGETLWGIIDKNGKTLVSCSYLNAQVLNNSNVLLCDKNGQWVIMSFKGKTVKN